MVEKAYEVSIGVDGSFDKDEAIAQAANYISYEVDIIDVDVIGRPVADWTVLITVAVDNRVIGQNDLYWNEHVDTVEEVSIELQ